MEKFETTCLIGRYISFDLLILKHQLKREKYNLKKLTAIDTLDLIGCIAPSFDIWDLEKYPGIFGTRIYPRHHALGDALTTAYFFVELLFQFQQRGGQIWSELLKVTND